MMELSIMMQRNSNQKFKPYFCKYYLKPTPKQSDYFVFMFFT